MAPHDLTTENGLLQYLSENSFNCSELTRLSEGGFSAYVFRGVLTTPLGNGEKSIIIKHVTGFAARGFTEFKLDPSRLVYEYRGLSVLGPLLTKPQAQTSTPDIAVQIPPVVHFDDANKTLIIQDLGPVPTLKSFLTSSTPHNVASNIGLAIANFLADLHSLATRDPSILTHFDSNQAGRSLSAFVYFGRLASEAAKFGFTDSFIADAAAQANREVLEAQEVLTMGDFWTGNVLVSESGEQQHIKPELFVIDWELAKPGTAEFDVGQMAAEMYFMTRREGIKEAAGTMLSQFLAKYRQLRAAVDAFKVVVRVGAHLVVIGQMTNPDAKENEIRELVNAGVELIRAGWTQDKVYLRNSFLAPLLGESEEEHKDFEIA